MRWNATYRYSATATGAQYVDGGFCYIEQTEDEQLRDAEWGKEIVLGYKMYVKDKSRFDVQLGNIVYIMMQDGQRFYCTVVGVDFTVNKVYTFTLSSARADTSEASGFNNGMVQFGFVAGGGIDLTTGMPIKPAVTWNPSGCHWQVVDINLLAKDIGGEAYKDAKYCIYVPIDTEVTERLKLSDNDGSLLGEFSAKSIIKMEVKGLVKIIV